ncbi:hypothetical protein fHeYen301_29 [Yersinia phage fHe-Yen3-01]|uniref:HNH nuclease domain-containing protein n=1 Tax=Yersinia phage fHe-Yen3-01 TaxID=1932893 RepID=A0A1L7DQS8_9CAUD|nr:endonuclease [Yersinia phage fHe-Yen3-01]APU00362.1 hypothetical protein fHeYen301_29 [Yersinia phage fHe-Yen3-01]
MTGCIDHGQHGEAAVHGTKWYKDGCVGYHVYSYCMANDKDPRSLKGTGIVVRHKCDNPRCINPDHLELGSHSDNMRDRVVRKTGCRGSKQKDAKLSYEIADVIRETVGKSQRALAKEYRVSQYQIWSVLNYKTWVK